MTELDEASWDAASMLPYLYLQLNRSEEAINDAKLLLTYKEASDENIRDELRSIISNGYVQLNRISEAIQWLDMIIAESKDRDLVEYTKGHRENLLQPL